MDAIMKLTQLITCETTDARGTSNDDDNTIKLTELIKIAEEAILKRNEKMKLLLGVDKFIYIYDN